MTGWRRTVCHTTRLRKHGLRSENPPRWCTSRRLHHRNQQRAPGGAAVSLNPLWRGMWQVQRVGDSQRPCLRTRVGAKQGPGTMAEMDSLPPPNPMSSTPQPAPKRFNVWQQNLNKSRVAQEDLINSGIHKDYNILALQEPYTDLSVTWMPF